ncbi:MAG: hypothetical protein GYB33_19290 [Gammaproteobacteria bacterium]|uniref:hypothetical protein n=1 Tax=Pseudomaricurvus alcaniphilus TaxID=1166482 RepID=UPI00140BDC65|nr:hypothetical protein [Pseudomaricurvus alcaniphilus]MBR9912490.1 hypothetical protein [Gammaproteobacteria bacterium]NHN36271.1 hypothetical protein [Pseudomaricurvus alcaniphilus]
MSTTITIALIIALAVAFLAYAFVSQTLDRKRKQRARIITALTSRSRDFKRMLNSFPPGFLSTGLNTFLHQSLVDISRQLCELEKTNNTHQEDLALYREYLEAARRPPQASRRTPLDSLQKAREARALLQDLHTLATQQRQKGALDEPLLKQYENELRIMALQITVDECLLNAHRAESKGKLQLAVHHYALAHKLLSQENSDGHYGRQLADISQSLLRLQASPEVRESGLDLEQDQG